MPTAPPRVVVIDTETTGLDPRQDRIIDLGAVLLGPDLEIEDRFSTLVDPGIPVPLFVTRLTGIDETMLAGAPSFAEAFRSLRAFAADAMPAAHNAPFDRDHLDTAAVRVGLTPLAGPWFDTLEAALPLFPELDRHALPLLAEHLGIDRRSHRALPDAETTAAVFARLCARAAGLAREERDLLERVSWRPLAALDRYAVAPDQGPAASVADKPRGGDKPLPVLPIRAGDWRAQLERPEAGVEGAAAPADQASPPLAERLPGFRHRPGQVQLAEAAARIFKRGGIGLYEAGTGMGKSLAYLLPAAFYGAANGRRVVVSTKTKALQRQLAAHELPLVADALPEGWRWALLMGRENYLCRRRLDEAATDVGELPDRDRALALAYLLGRARHAEVDLSALPYRATQELRALPELARELRSSRASCLGRHCAAQRDCYWRRARSRAEAAHLVCVNHALLLTGREALPPFEDVVIDEAHLLYHEAAEAFTDGVSSAALDLMLTDLRGRRSQRPLGARLRGAARRALPDEGRLIAAAGDACDRAAGVLPDLVHAVGGTLSALITAADQASSERGLPEGNRDSAYDQTAWLTPGLREQPAWDPFASAAALLGESLAALAADLGPAAEALPEDHRERAGVLALMDDAAEVARLLDELPESTTAETVVWGRVEARGRYDAAARWTLARTPLTPARAVRDALWDRLRSAVLTSATLTVSGSFGYFRAMTGLDADLDVDERVFASPFDFRRQAVLVLEHDPEGAWRPEDLAARQGERLRRLAEVTGGRTLALFTNKRDMHQVAATVGDHLEDDGVLVLAQGLHGSAASLAEEFRTHPETILLGVDTLWTGQDFPGDALTCLVIAKLPFPRQDPLFHARKRACDEAGQRWFDRFYLPEAVLKFRQGFGRLIRTESDVGVVVVLDHRLSRQAYRRDFIASLPDIEVIEAAPADIAAVVGHHLRRLTAAQSAATSAAAPST